MIYSLLETHDSTHYNKNAEKCLICSNTMCTFILQKFYIENHDVHLMNELLLWSTFSKKSS